MKHCRDVPRAALNVAMKWNLVSRNAAALTMISNPRKAKPHFYDESQAEAFLEAISGDRLEALFWLALGLGPREGELLGLRWTDFDFEKGTVTILRSLKRIKRKGRKKEPFGAGSDEDGRQRSECLGASTRPRKGAGASKPSGRGAHFGRQRVARDGHGFHDAHRHTLGSAKHAARVLPAARPGATAQDRFHDLRHSAATILGLAGIPDQAIQKLLGHASVRTTQEIYEHLTPSGGRQAAGKMDEIFGPVAVKTTKGSVN